MKRQLIIFLLGSCLLFILNYARYFDEWTLQGKKRIHDAVSSEVDKTDLSEFVSVVYGTPLHPEAYRYLFFISKTHFLDHASRVDSVLCETVAPANDPDSYAICLPRLNTGEYNILNRNIRQHLIQGHIYTNQQLTELNSPLFSKYAVLLDPKGAEHNTIRVIETIDRKSVVKAMHLLRE
ncbi:hypothetical protein JXO52_17380 [bacterium]|nr:hypothetical protein [bacterium]